MDQDGLNFNIFQSQCKLPIEMISQYKPNFNLIIKFSF